MRPRPHQPLNGPVCAADSGPRSVRPVILSDISIRKAIAEGRIVIEPLMDGGVQPSSVDLRVDRYFRVFRNDTTPFIDPKLAQEDLTELVEVGSEGSFILHPGEFVLGSTLERVSLPDDLVARLDDHFGRAAEVPVPVIDNVVASVRVAEAAATLRERTRCPRESPRIPPDLWWRASRTETGRLPAPT